MATVKLNLSTAEATREKLTKEQETQIRKLYESAAKKVAEEAKRAPRVPSDSLRASYLNKLKLQLNNQMLNVGKSLEEMIKNNTKIEAEAVVQCSLNFLKTLGMPIEGAFSHVPDDIVKSLLSGQLYDGDWSLSKSIWGGTRKTQRDINTIISEGVAMNKSAYDIAKDLEQYVDPTARKDWEWSKVYPGTNRVVDYNAQRLARTMVSHAYQQSFIKTTQSNPFVEAYRWLVSNSHRTCEICIDRSQNDHYGLGDGVFPKDQLPLDHPNGMCTYEAVITSNMTQIADRLADWAEGKSDPALDAYAKTLYGSDAAVNKAKKETKPNPDAWLGGLSKGDWINKNLSRLRISTSKSYGKAAWDEFKNKLMSMNENQLKLLSMGNNSLKNISAAANGEGCYNKSLKTIFIDLLSDMDNKNKSGAYSVFFHEYGHLLDSRLYKGVGSGSVSGTKAFGSSFYKSLQQEYAKLAPNGHLSPRIKQELLREGKSAGVQDIIDGLSLGKDRVYWGHGASYWERRSGANQWKEVTSESFANMSSAYMNPEIEKVVVKYFPKSYEMFVKEVESRL